MIPVRGIVRGVLAELWAIGGVLALTRWPFWVAVLILPAVALAGVALDGSVPAGAAVAIQAAALLLFFLAGLFSGRVARVVRRWRWVRYPHGPAVHPYLPQLITLLASGPYFLAMGGLFLLVGRHFPACVAVAGPEEAAWRVLDQILHGGLFFDALEIYHIETAPKPSHWTGQTLVFATRFAMDLVFVKLLIQILRAALHRARGLGRGEDLLAQIHRELNEGDEARVTALAQAGGDSLRDAVDDLIRQRGAIDLESRAGQSLLAMGEFAVPYLRAQAQWQTGQARADLEAAAARLEATRDELNAALDECQRSAGDFRQTPGWATLVRRRVVAMPFVEDRLASAADDQRPALGRIGRALRATDPSASWLRATGRVLVLAGLWATLAVAAAGPFLFDGEAALALSGVMVVLLGLLVVGARATIVWLVGRGVLRPASPRRLPWVVAVWTLALAPLLAADAARLFQTAQEQVPGVFGDSVGGPIDFPSASMYVLENLLRTQLFIDVVEIYGLHVVRLETQGFLGGTLTLLVRLIFDLSLIGLIVSFATIWFNRVYRGLAVSPNAELELRAEAHECGPLGPLHVRHYYREVRDFFVERMRACEHRPELFVALVAAGFLEEYYRQHPASGASDPDAIARHLRVGGLLRDRAYRRADSLIELQRAVGLLEPAESGGAHRDDLLAQADIELAYTLWYLNRHPESEVRAAAAIRARRAQVQAGVARSLDLAWARYIRAVILYSLSRPADALEEYRAAVELYRAALEAETRADVRLDIQRKIGMALSEMGLMLEMLQRHEESEKAHREGIAILETSQWEHAPWAREDRATYRCNLGNVYVSLNRLDEAEKTYRKAHDECRDLERDGLLHHPRITALTLVNLGFHYRRANRLPEAARAFDEARVEYERALRRGCLELRGDLCTALIGVGQCRLNLGQPDDAEEPLLGASELFRRLVHQEGRNDLRRWLADAHFNLALLRQAQNRAADALPEFESAVREYEPCQGGDVRGNLAEVRVHWAEALANGGNARPARPIIEAAVPVLRTLVEGEGCQEWHSTYFRGLAAQGMVHRGLGELDRAVACFEDALQRYRAQAAEGDAGAKSSVPWCCWRLAEALAGGCDSARAESTYREAYDEFVALRDGGRDDFDVHHGLAQSRMGLGAVLVATNRPAEAVGAYRGALDHLQTIRDRKLGEGRPGSARCRLRLGEVAAAQQDWATAETHVRPALTLLEELVGEGMAALRGDLMRALFQLGGLRARAGAKTEAGTFFDQAAAIAERFVDDGDPTAPQSAVLVWRNQFANLPTPQHADATALLRHLCDCLTRWHPNRDRFSEASLTAVRQFLTEAQRIAGPASAVARAADLYDDDADGGSNGNEKPRC